MEAPAGNCHLRARPGSSDRPYPLNSINWVEPLYSSTQSKDSWSKFFLVVELMTSLIYSPVVFDEANCCSMAAALSWVLAMPGVGDTVEA